MKRWRTCLWTMLLLCLLATLLAMPAFGAQIVETGSCGDSATYTLDADGLLTISGSGSVDSHAFDENDAIKKVVVEPGITSIGSSAFENCDSLTSVTLPEGLTSIGDYTFYDCASLTSVTLPEGLTSIGDYTFYDCASLSSVTLPEGLTSIGSFAFYECDSLSSVTLPEGLTSIGDWAFGDCDSLSSVTLPEGLTSIGSGAFQYCDSLTSVTLPEGLTSIGTYAFAYCHSLSSVTLPEGLTSIGYHTFYDCASLSSVTLPEGLTSIGDGAFYNCDSLTSVTLPEGLTSIGEYAFYSCNSLSSVTLPQGLTSIGDCMFEDCDSLSSVTLPEGLTRIGSYAFEDCASLSSVTLPEGLTSIGSSAFLGCDSLSSVTLPEGLTSIGEQAFWGCNSLTSVTLPEGLTSIRDYTFYDCDSLTSVTLPEGLTSIGEDAFASCDDLDQLIFLGDLPEIETNAFEGSSPTVYYVEGNATWYNGGKKKYGGTPTYKPLGSPVELVVTVADPYSYYFTGDRVEKRDVDATLVYDSGARSLLHPGMFELTGGELASPGVKALTVTAQGVRASVIVYVHNGGVIEVDPAEWPESRHDYNNSIDDTQVLTAPGADQIQITFSDRTQVESGCDYLYVYAGDGTQVAAYTGDEAAGKTLTVQGDTVKICLVTDGSGTGWGYALSHVEAMWVEHVYESEGGPCVICRASTCAHDHVEGVITAEPTCQAEGIITYTCVDCGHSYTEVLPATGHNWVDGDCTTPKHCTNCGETQGTTSGHAYDSGRVTTSASCENAGVRTYTCSKCGHSYTESIPAYGHDWVDADCMTPRHCADCGLSSGSALGHRMVEASCELPSHCTYCGLADGEPLGHDYLVTTGVCSRCSETAPFTVEAPQMEYCYGSTQVKVRAQWTKVEGIDGYELYMSTDPDDLRTFELVKSVKDPNTLTYTKGGLTPGVTYYFRVCAYVLLEDELTRVRSPLSNVKYCMPTVLWDSPYSNSDFRIRLRWEPVDGADGYQIWREGEGEAYRVVKTVKDGLATAYSNVSLRSGGTYTYKMRAYFINEDGTRNYGTFSDEVTVGVQPSKSQITVTSPKAGRAQISWEDLYGASAYQVWMSESPDSGFKIVKSIYDGDVTTYTKTGLVSGKTYYFKVRASVEVDGKKSFGAYSDTIAITIK